MFEQNLSEDLQEVTSQTLATASALGQISAEIKAAARDDRHSAALAGKVLDAQAKRAALAATSLAALAGRMAALAKLGAVWALLAFCLAACGAAPEPGGDYCPQGRLLAIESDPDHCSAASPGAPSAWCRDPPPSDTCTVVGRTEGSTYQLWAFDPVPASNPDPASCVDRGKGVYECQTLTACTFRAGDCRRCSL